MKTRSKLVITCPTLPPLVIGSTVLMTNLFNSYKGDIEAIAGWEYGAKVDNNFHPPCATTYIRLKPDLLQRLTNRFNGSYLLYLKWRIYRLLKQKKPTAVFAAFAPNGAFFVATYIACKKLNIPFWGHIHDLWLENTKPGTPARKIAEKWEPIIFKGAEKICCMTEHQLEYYKKKYPRTYDFIPHCVKDAKISLNDLTNNLAKKQLRPEKTILYTGNISHVMNLDAMQTFVKAVDLLPAHYKVKMFTGFNAESAKPLGLFNPRIEYKWVSVEEAKKNQENADLLFLPLSFKNGGAEEVDTVFATKTLDYLLSGTPILVHSPESSYHTWSARKNGWGYVVSEDSPEALANGIIDLLKKKDLQKTIIQSAYNEALNRQAAKYADQLLQSANLLV